MQLGPVVRTRASLAAQGLPASHGDRLVRAGRWTRVAPSTYLTGPPGLLDRMHAALEHAGRDAVVTGWAACTALRMSYADDAGAIDVLVPATRRRVSTDAIRVMPTTRPPEFWLWKGVRVAAPARCVIDAARALGTLPEVRALVLGAEGIATHAELLAELRAGSRGHRALVGRAVGDLADGARSCPEAELADLVGVAAAAGGLPPFLLNPDVLVRGRLLGRPDGWFPGLGLGWEVDSRRHHGSDEDLDATLARHDTWLTHGLSLLHVTPRRLRALGVGYLPVLAAAARMHARRPEPAGVELLPCGPLLPRSRRSRWAPPPPQTPGQS